MTHCIPLTTVRIGRLAYQTQGHWLSIVVTIATPIRTDLWDMFLEKTMASKTGVAMHGSCLHVELVGGHVPSFTSVQPTLASM